MLYFPIADDTRDLKILVKKGIFKFNEKEGKLIYGSCYKVGDKVGQGYSYDWNYKYDHFSCDKECIYQNDEPIALAELLVNKLLDKDKYDDDVEYILNKRNLTTEPISYGSTEALFYEGESFADKDYKIAGLIIKAIAE